MQIRIVVFSMILLLELLNSYYSNSLATELDTYYSLTSRYSARISFSLLSVLAIWIIIKNLQNIFDKAINRNLFISLLIGFSINHVIHLYFLYQNFQVNNLSIANQIISPGALAYIILIIAPIYF